jgi:putative glycosyltransferase (TIGR04372 family)
MKSILFDLQKDKINFTSSNNSPAFLSYHWATRFGHLGALCMKLKFDEMFKAEKVVQKIYIKEKFLFGKFEYLFTNKIIPVNNLNLLDFERPSNWAEFDLLHMIRFNEDYIEHNAMHELVYSSCKVDRANPLVRHPQTRQELLEKMNLDAEDWYVAIHIRNTNYQYDERKVDQFKFNEALESVISAGGKVIQFGQNMTKAKVSDLSKIRYLPDIEGSQNLDTSVIAHSDFLLTTSSGPIGVAHALGIPVLQTDCPAICMHAKTASVGTLYLPKKLIKNGKEVTYSQLAETGLGYKHISMLEWRELGFEIVENSSTEILNATLEMLNPIKINSELRQKLDSIRSDHKALARGNFANSYLEKNKWILS